MKATKKLFSGPMWKPKSTGPFHQDRNSKKLFIEEGLPGKKPSGKKVFLGVALTIAAGFSLWAAIKIHNVNRKERPFTMSAECTKARKAKEIALGWWQEEYWKKGDAIYLPTPSQSDWFGDSPADWPVEKALAYLNDDEWWEEFEQTRPRGWVNILPEALQIFKIKKNSMEAADEEDEEEEDEEDEEGGEEADKSFLYLPYNAFNPSAPLPTQRADYRRVMEVIYRGFPRKAKEVPAPYNNPLAGCTAIIDPDGPKPIKVTFSNDWRDLSPELLKLIRERLIWKYKDDWENYTPPQLSQVLKDKWNDHLSVSIKQDK